MSEQWIQWIPYEGLPYKVNLEELLDNKNGVSLSLTDNEGNQEIQVLFENLVLSYRNTDEGRRLKTIRFLEEKYNTDFYAKWSFFKVYNSTYLEWFRQETYNIYDTLSIEHYVFLTNDDIVDVLSTYEPKVNICKNK